VILTVKPPPDGESALAPKRAGWRRPELWIPGLFLAVSAAWIYGSDALVAAIAGSVERARALSVYKGMGYILVTAALIHLGIRLALRRERAAARRVEESEALLRAITDGTPDPVFLKDRGGRWLFANPGTLRAIGRTLAQVLGKTDLEIYDDRSLAEALMATDRRIMERGQGEAVEEQVEGPNGQRIYLSTKSPLRDAAGQVIGVIGVARDVTDRKRAERELLAAEERVRQAEKLESVGRLAGGVAHEFNNLLTVILSAAEGLAEDLRAGGTASVVDDVEQIRLAGARARELTKQLLAVGRRQAAAPVPLDLDDALRAQERMLRHVLGEGVTLALDLAPEGCAVLCDPAQLDQVILNLALNARDAMPRGGRLSLRTRVLGPEAAPPGDAGDGGAPADRRWVELLVQDDGAGMLQETIDHVFEPFFTTKAPGKGTGLGLATVYGIVTQAEGHVSVQSALGQGTTFRVLLPYRPSRARGAAPGAELQPAAPPGQETVLAVEDDPLVRSVTVRALRAGGYHVLEAGTGPEAVALVRALEEPINLLVTDVVMPTMDGPALADELRRLRPQLKVLYVSGYPDEVITGREAHAAGMDLLPKPFTPAALLARVRAVLDR
jgi:two-component system cell cycle sensor histidine kinase/response regulator CckA